MQNVFLLLFHLNDNFNSILGWLNEHSFHELKDISKYIIIILQFSILNVQFR